MTRAQLAFALNEAIDDIHWLGESTNWAACPGGEFRAWFNVRAQALEGHTPEEIEDAIWSAVLVRYPGLADRWAPRFLYRNPKDDKDGMLAYSIRIRG